MKQQPRESTKKSLNRKVKKSQKSQEREAYQDRMEEKLRKIDSNTVTKDKEKEETRNMLWKQMTKKKVKSEDHSQSLGYFRGVPDDVLHIIFEMVATKSNYTRSSFPLVCRRFYRITLQGPKVHIKQIPMTSTSKTAVVSLLHKRAAHLRDLSLRGLDSIPASLFTSQILTPILSHCPKLERLDLSYTKYNNSGLLLIAKHCTNLRSLILNSRTAGAPTVKLVEQTNQEKEVFKQLVQSLPKLEAFECASLSEEKRTLLATHCPRLHTLIIHNGDHKLKDFLVFPDLKELQSVSSPNGLSTFCRTNTCLERLHLKREFDWAEGGQQRSLIYKFARTIPNLTHLRHLSLSGPLSLWFFNLLRTALPDLESLAISGTFIYSVAEAETKPELSEWRIKSLKIGKLSRGGFNDVINCSDAIIISLPELTDLKIKSTFKKHLIACPKLQTADFVFSHDRDTLLDLDCPSLKNLSLVGDDWFKKQSGKTVTLPNFSFFHFSAPLLTSLTIKELSISGQEVSKILNCHQTLLNLAILGCGKVESLSIIHKNLLKLHIKGCSILPYLDVKTPSLQDLFITDCDVAEVMRLELEMQSHLRWYQGADLTAARRKRDEEQEKLTKLH